MTPFLRTIDMKEVADRSAVASDSISESIVEKLVLVENEENSLIRIIQTIWFRPSK